MIDHSAAPRPSGRASLSWEAVVAMLIGLLAFLSIRGARIAAPGNSGWLVTGDPMTMQLGWLFFRDTPLWQWPLGANPDYGMALGSSIVYSDSIPVLALASKLLGPWLPQDFQYFGLWLASCFVLQGLLAWKLLCRLGVDRRLALLGCAFFVLAPTLHFRLLQGHYALVAHWLVLAALYLYFGPRPRPLAWGGLLVLTAMVHAYLLVMVWGLWCADLVQRHMLRHQRPSQALLQLALVHAAIGFVMAALGYFMLGQSVGEQGYGIYRLNLLAFFDPDALWSRLLRDQPSGEGEYEGFAFLGLGVLLAALAGLAHWLGDARWRWRPGLAPLCVMLAGMSLYAITPQVYLGAQRLLQYSLPAFVDGLTSAFRASGRLVWPLYYAATAGALCLLLRRFPRRVAMVLCVALLAAQWTDGRMGRNALRDRLGMSAAWSPSLRGPVWQDFARQYRKVLVVYPRNAGYQWFALGSYAVRHGMSVNVVYLSRVPPQVIASQKSLLTQVVERAEYADDALYVFEDDALWHSVLAGRRADDVVGIVDGMRVLAPGLRRCADCTAAAAIVPPPGSLR